MRIVILPYVLIALLLSLGACSLLGSEESPSALVDTKWKLVSFVVDGEKIARPEGQPFEIGFTETGTLLFLMHCNGGSGTYEASADGSITLNPEVSTYVDCGEDSYDEEVGQQLVEADTYNIMDDRLLLRSTDDDTLSLTFERIDSFSSPELPK